MAYKAQISKADRELFERYGEAVVGRILSGGFSPNPQELGRVYTEKPLQNAASDWLAEQVDRHNRRETKTFWIEVFVLVFVIAGVVLDALILWCH